MKKIKCLICGKEVSNNNSYIGSHVKRIHNILLHDYVKEYYHNDNKNFKIEKCGFCNRNAIPNIIIDHIEYNYKYVYDHGYKCNTIDCKNNISLDILGHRYDKKTFEHIGANARYLCKLHKKSIKDVKRSKAKGLINSTWTVSLENYILKFGKIDGEKKYKERCKKISKANTKKWFIDKYGQIEGERKWEEFRKKKHRAFGPSKSKSSEIISKILCKNNINFIEEYKFELNNGNNGSIDYYLPDYNLIIEFYGDYWHCNPKFYNNDYFHKIMKIQAKNVWKRDKERILYIFEKNFNKKITILIIWESTKFSEEYLIKLILEIKNKYTILEI